MDYGLIAIACFVLGFIIIAAVIINNRNDNVDTEANDEILTKSLISSAMHFLECTQIMFTAKTVEICARQFDPLLKAVEELQGGANKSCYKYAAIKGKMEYQSTDYANYDRPVYEFQVNALNNPIVFDARNFYGEAIALCVKRISDIELNANTTLQQKSAKKKHLSHWLQQIKIAEKELNDHCADTPNYQQYKKILNNLEQSIIAEIENER